MDSPVEFPKFTWTAPDSIKYFKTIEEINDAYTKKLMIGKAKKVVWDQVCPLLMAKTKKVFKKTKRKINKRYWNYIKNIKPTLLKLRVDV